jgi:hypothetical protein
MRKGAIILLLSLCFAAYVLYSLTGVEPVKVGAVRMVRNAGTVSVEGDVRNTGDDTGPLEVEVRYFDSNGRPQGKDVVSINALSRGASAHFKSSPRPDVSVADFSIYLNHGRNPYGN